MIERFRAALAAFVTAAGTPAFAQIYEIESMAAHDLGTFGGEEAVANDVNDKGEVAGWAHTATGTPRPFVHRNGALLDVGGPAGVPGYAFGINNAPEVVGYYIPAGEAANAWTPFHWSIAIGWPHTLDAGALSHWGVARAINDAGHVVGKMSIANAQCASQVLPVQWTSAYAPWSPIYCPPDGEFYTDAADINESGHIVGSEYLTNIRAIRWTGTKQVVPYPAGLTNCYMYGSGINGYGFVVGRATQCVGGERAWFWNGNALQSTLIPTLSGGSENDAQEVNDQFFVVGYSEALFHTGGQFGYAWRDRAYIWNSLIGTKALPTLPSATGTATHCRALGVSNRDPVLGLIRVAGYCTTAAGKKRAVRWDVKVKLHTITPPT